jgi:hypothetical protein
MAQKLNLIIDQGTTFYTSFLVNDDDGVPINFTGYSGHSQIRKHYTSTNAVAITVTANSSGSIMLFLDSNTTNSLEAGRYVYDVELVAPGNTSSRVVEGIVTVTPQVTK